MAEDRQLKAAVRALKESASIEDVHTTMRELAPRFHDALEGRVVPGPRPELGMDLSTMSGRAGFTARKGKSFFVSIGRDSDAGEKRFTLAHELGHVLLDAVDRSAIPLNRSQEERLCEQFASRAIAPREKVDRYLRQQGYPAELGDVGKFAGHFRITLRAAIVVLDEVVPKEWPVAFVAASLREHPQRRVLGLRVDAAASERRLLFPVHCRLATLGYRELETRVLREDVGAVLRGSAASVRVRSRARKVSGWTGKSEWVARVHNAPGADAEPGARGVLCCIDTRRLVPTSTRPRPRARLSQGARELPGQLRF